jgi:ribosomal protein S18 acetylase RimI-like enzyme
MRKATVSDKPHLINLLTRAFEGNKSVSYVVKPGGDQVTRVKRLMEYSLDNCFAFGEVWVSDDRNACALLLFTDQKKTTLKSIFWNLKLAFTVIGLSRVSAVLKRDKLLKAHHPKGEFAYLFFLAVDPGVQGKGAGSALMHEVIAECDRRNRPIYLETSVERNLPFYQKLGFEIFATVRLSYKLYIIRRLLNVPRQ